MGPELINLSAIDPCPPSARMRVCTRWQVGLFWGRGLSGEELRIWASWVVPSLEESEKQVEEEGTGEEADWGMERLRTKRQEASHLHLALFCATVQISEP